MLISAALHSAPRALAEKIWIALTGDISAAPQNKNCECVDYHPIKIMIIPRLYVRFSQYDDTIESSTLSTQFLSSFHSAGHSHAIVMQILYRSLKEDYFNNTCRLTTFCASTSLNIPFNCQTKRSQLIIIVCS